ncbi:hypothetical protein H4R27_006485, partial [Coemansia aciculifera]
MSIEEDVDSTTSAHVRVQEAGEFVENEPVTDVPVTLLDSDSTSGEGSVNNVSPLVVNPTAAVTVTTQAPRQAVLPMEFNRQSVIRDGLLRQGLSESAINSYFDQFSKSTNDGYNSTWKLWAG